MQFNILKYLFLSLIFFTGVIISEKIILKPEDYHIETKVIEKKLHEIEKNVDEVIDNFIEEIAGKKITKETNSETWLTENDNYSLSNKGLTIIIYQNDSLRYWSDNSLSVPIKYSNSSFYKEKVVRLANGWFEVRKKSVDNIVILGFIKLKNSFSYENKYLTNYFRKELKIPSSVKISAIPVAHGKNIKNKEGDYTFSLVPVNKVILRKESTGITGILYFLSFAFFLLFLNQIFLYFTAFKYYNLILLAFIGLIGFGRYLMIEYNLPSFIYSLNFYDVGVYAGDGIFEYFGDFMINSMFLVFFTVNIFRIIPVEKFFDFIARKASALIYIFAVFFVLLGILLTDWYLVLISQLIKNSSIHFEIHKIQDITIYSTSAYIIISILIASLIIFADKFIKIFALLSKFKFYLLSIISGAAFIFAMYFLSVIQTDLFGLIFFIVITLIISVVRFFKNEYRYYIIIVFTFISSVFIINFVYKHTEQRIKTKQKILLPELEEERDDIAEMLLEHVEQRFKKDTILVSKLRNIVPDHEVVVRKYLEKKYFNGSWEKYKLTVSICGNSIYYRNENQADYCENYFTREIIDNSKKIENLNFYFHSNQDGTITYFGTFKVPESIDERKITLYIQLKEELVSKILGYPELLIDEDNQIKSKFENYSYAKYSNGKLVSKYGNFAYDLSDKVFKKIKGNSGFIKFDHFRHYILKPDKDSLIVISKETTKTVDIVISFAYLFVMLNILVLISILIINYKFILKKLKADFNNKIQFSLYLILFITFVLFGAGTVYYATEQYREIQNKEMSEKIQSVLTELEHKLGDEENLTPLWKSDQYDHLDELLIKFTQVFFSDINLYDLNGYLLATSRPEIFQKGLIGKQMNRKAFTQLALNKKVQFIQDEYIGSLKYASVYVPFKNKDNKTLAYINLPYFGTGTDLQENISKLLITTVNIYVVLFLLTIIVAFAISAKITQPLRVLQSKFKEIKLGKEYKKINYTKNDEIGDIVKEYNRMINELHESVKKLAESERESAWREMAKQIAHEIKNPLTPMKLSVQLLQRSWNDNQENFDERLSSVSETIIEQIDTLSAIASEFSAFAKMPKAQNEEVELVSKLKNVVKLFETTKNIDIQLELFGNDDVKIIADKEQLSRVFINIIKNGIQSIPEGVNGKIYIELARYGNTVKVTIEDNGSGISDDKKDKLFKPSFTTKTKGMGMGLAIVKNIVNNAGGEIWFESEFGKGTKFFIEYPMVK